jgi:hypothetical protein
VNCAILRTSSGAMPPNVFFRELVRVEPKFGFELTIYMAAEEQGT